MNDDVAFWLSYLTNGKHIAWYASVQFTLIAAVCGGAIALACGLGAAAARNSRPWPVRMLAAGYINIVRGIPDVLFLLFFPLAFEQAVEWAWSSQICSGVATGSTWPPCEAANLRLGTSEYLALACVALGLVYGAFAANVISGALKAVPHGQLEAARAFGLSPTQILWRIHVRQMWVYALPGLSNVWLLLIKATALLSLLQIVDFITWAERLGAANYSRVAGLVHDDWRWRYYLVLLVFYIALTFLSEKAFAALNARVRRGMPLATEHAA